MQKYDFGLDGTNRTCHFKLSIDRYRSNRPQQWVQFMKFMFPNTSNTNTDEWLLKFDTLFQSINYWLNSERSKTPFHSSLTQTVHNLSKSRQLITILNRMKLASSYDSMKWINILLALKIVADILPNRCAINDL